MTEQTERVSAISSSNEEVDYVENVDVKVDHVELSEGEAFEQHQPKKQKMKKKKKMNKINPKKTDIMMHQMLSAIVP